jgi:hypothetical protein
VGISSEEIRANVSRFAERYLSYDKSERQGAQTFLNELFECYGTYRPDVADFEKPQEGKFLDLLWPGNCLIEMKAPGETKRLAKHRKQALDYWENSGNVAKGIRQPRYVVLCSFHAFEVWEPGAFRKEPVATFELRELPERYDALLFLAGEGRQGVFIGSQQQVTREAVAKVVTLYHSLRERKAARIGELQDFLLQCVWCMFAEDLAMIPAHGFTRIARGILDSGGARSSAHELGTLFDLLGSEKSPRHGIYEGIPYANGGLFVDPSHVHLEPSEIELLLSAAHDYEWNKVDPTIFGSLLEGGLGADQQHALGAHYTHEVDIQRIVQPTIVRPWQERIENLTTETEARAAQHDLMNYVVLDPACGSGNFLYVAYRELRRLEARLHEREIELRRTSGRKATAAGQGALTAFFPLTNIRGIELETFAVKLARVTLWMGHKLAVDELDLPERTLPLADLSGIQRGNALDTDWPRANAIIGNPPFHGDRQLRGQVGDDEVEWLKQRFGVGVKDYCVYWFRKAVEEAQPDDRIGFVATNSVSQNRARKASIEHIVEQGGVITDAVSTSVWPGDASVYVSIVNWIHRPTVRPASFTLDGQGVEGILPTLTPAGHADLSQAQKLPHNKGRGFQGQVLRGIGFAITPEEAADLIAREDASYAEVVRPFLNADEITSDPRQEPRRWVIDFAEMPLEDAMRYPAALDIVRRRVLPKRENDPKQMRYWWRHWNPRPAMRRALDGKARYIAAPIHAKRVLFCWQAPEVCSSHGVIVFAFDDDYSMGVLSSAVHVAWARGLSSTLGETNRYTPSSVFETFPWPVDVPDSLRDRIADTSRRLIARRADICTDRDIGLTTLYNQMDEGAWRDLAALHSELDQLVAEAYGWPASIAQDADETNRRLLELNQQIAAGEIAYDPFAATPAASAT